MKYRLAGARAQGHEPTADSHEAWGSDLSVGELVALQSVGFQPAGLVMGTSVQQLGRAYSVGGGVAVEFTRPWRSSQPGAWFDSVRFECPHGAGTGTTNHGRGYNVEQPLHSEAVEAAYARAVSQLTGQARHLHAHGVLGARTRIQWRSRATVVEFSVIGTAVSRPGAPLLPEPFTSHLTAQDFAKLLLGGWMPASLAVGIGRVQANGGCASFRSFSARANWDVPQHGAALDWARRIAVERLRSALPAHADGVVGTTTETSLDRTPWMKDSWTADVLVMGTSVVRVRRHGVDDPRPALTLR